MRGTISHTRRSFMLAIASAYAAGLAAMMAGAVPVAASTDTPVAAAYREWIAFEKYLRTAEISDDEFDAENARHFEMLLALVALPSACAADTLMKFVAFTEHGLDFSDDAHGTSDAILADARAMVEGVL